MAEPSAVPVAIRPAGDERVLDLIGMAVRLPGCPDLAAFWRLLSAGGDVLGDVGADRARLPGLPGERRRGGYLDDVADFDAAFFDIGPAEADAMDPAQRLLLQETWHALEDAGLSPVALRGQAVGVFVGAAADDYALLRRPEVARARRAGAGGDPYAVTGLSRAFLANRVSHQFGWTGPSMVVDTGQSSSAVALDQAAKAIAVGDCDLAVVAGVQLNLGADGDDLLADLGALSPEGRSRPFDASSDGIVRGEGVSVVVLAPAAHRARWGAAPPYASVLASAVNNDGGGPGLTVPDEGAQVRLLRTAYERAGVPTAAVAHVETHGTGTPTGDPVEVRALASALGGGRRPMRPLLIGSVKGAVGHLEAGAGLVGVVTTALCLHHGSWVATAGHLQPTAALEDRSVEVVAARRPLRRHPGSRTVAGVSSFGLGGTNAHIVLASVADERPARPGARPSDDPVPGMPVPLLVSGRDHDALRRQCLHTAEALERWLDVTPADDVAVGIGSAALATVRRPLHHPVRWASGGPLHDATAVRRLVARMRSVAAGEATPSREPRFAWALGDGLASSGDGAPAAHPAYVEAHAAARAAGLSQRYAALIGTAGLWRSWGAWPSMLVGDGGGELVVAHLAGLVDLADLATLLAHREGSGVHDIAAVAGRVARTAALVEPRATVCSVAAGLLTAEQLQDAERWIALAQPTNQHYTAVPAVRVAQSRGATGVLAFDGPSGALGSSEVSLDGPASVVAVLDPRGDGVVLGQGLAVAYVAGADLDGERIAADLRPGAAVERVHWMPGYAFARTRHWGLGGSGAEEQPPPRHGSETEGHGPRPAVAPAQVERAVHDALERALGAPLAPSDRGTSFTDLGLDSRATLAVVALLRTVLARRLPATLLFDHPTPDRLVVALSDEVGARSPAVQ